MNPFTDAMETLKPRTRCEVPIHFIATGEVAYTIHAVISSSIPPPIPDLILIALREIRYPDGTVTKAFGSSCAGGRDCTRIESATDFRNGNCRTNLVHRSK